MLTNILNVQAPNGSIGSFAEPLTADLVQSETIDHVERPIEVTVVAGGNAYLNFTGYLRDPDFNPNTTPFIVPLGSIQADGNVVALLQESVQESAPGSANSGIVVYENFTNLTTLVSNHFRPGTGGGTAPATDPGFFDSDPTLINSTYSFANLVAGGNIQLFGIPTATIENGSLVTPAINLTGFTNINPTPSAAGQISASTNGNIAFTETEGAMRVGNIASTGGNVALTVPPNDASGDDFIMAAGSSVSATQGAVTIDVADNVTIPVGSTIFAGFTALIQGDYGKSAGVAGSVIAISGQIFAPIANVNGGADDDLISLTNVPAGTVMTVNTGDGVNTVNVGSIPPPEPNNGILDAIQGPLTINGDGADTLNVDDTGDPNSETGTLTSTALTGLSMGESGIAYSGLLELNIDLGLASDVFNIQSTPAGTATTIITQATGNTWNVGSLAPSLSGGVLAGIQGQVYIGGGGSNTELTDTINFDDSGSTNPSEYGVLTGDSLTKLGMGPGGVTFVGQAVLNINLGDNGTTLQGFIVNNLPATTNITGGPSNTDSFISEWDQDFNGTLNLTHIGDAELDVAGQFYGNLNTASPADIDSLIVGGSVNAGSSIVGPADRLTLYRREP